MTSKRAKLLEFAQRFASVNTSEVMNNGSIK